MRAKVSLVVPALMALAACGSDPEPSTTSTGDTAAGEVLGGSTSDAMLPLDTVTSQSPPMKVEPSSAPSSSAPQRATVEAEPEPEPEEAAPEPAAVPQEQAPAAEEPAE